jgi:hypothetical protein
MDEEIKEQAKGVPAVTARMKAPECTVTITNNTDEKE